MSHSVSMDSSCANTLFIFLTIFYSMIEGNGASKMHKSLLMAFNSCYEKHFFHCLPVSFSILCCIYCCNFLCPSSKCNSFFFLGMGSKVQSRWEQDSICGWRSINKYIWLPNLIFCFTLWTVIPHFLWLSSYARRKN
jgi:hypothetical protein